MVFSFIKKKISFVLVDCNYNNYNNIIYLYGRTADKKPRYFNSAYDSVIFYGSVRSKYIVIYSNDL